MGPGFSLEALLARVDDDDGDDKQALSMKLFFLSLLSPRLNLRAESTVRFAPLCPAGFVNFCEAGKACFLWGRASIPALDLVFHTLWMLILSKPAPDLVEQPYGQMPAERN